MKELVIVATVTALIVWGGVALLRHSQQERAEWNAFAKAHACRKVAHIRGDVYLVNGFDSKGNMTTGTAVSPDKTGYACDDGVTYYR